MTMTMTVVEQWPGTIFRTVLLYSTKVEAGRIFQKNQYVKKYKTKFNKGQLFLYHIDRRLQIDNFIINFDQLVMNILTRTLLSFWMEKKIDFESAYPQY